MTEAIANIGSFLGSIGSKLGTGLKTVGSDLGTDTGKGLLTLGTLGGGFLQNLMAARQANAKQKFVQDLITDPAKFNALVAKTEQPLSQGLTTDIARQADAYGAERGLGSSPAIMKDEVKTIDAPITGCGSIKNRAAYLGIKANTTRIAAQENAIYRLVAPVAFDTPTRLGRYSCRSHPSGRRGCSRCRRPGCRLGSI